MKKLLLAGVAAGMLAAGAPAQAHPSYHYRGGCSFATVSDGDNGQQTTWTGEWNVVVLATTADGVPAFVPISVRCDVYVNGVFNGTIGSASGITVAVNAGTYVYQADPSDVITVCEVVDVNGEEHTTCGNAETTPIVPQPVIDAINLVLDTLDGVVIQYLDPALCAVLAKTSPGVPGVVDITPEGDTYILGEFFWDCPPYAVA